MNPTLRNIHMKYFMLLAALFLSAPAFAADMQIKMLNKDSGGNKMVLSE